MKLKVKIKRINKNISLPKFTYKGDWVDLRASETVEFEAPKVVSKQLQFDLKLLPLGVAIELPKGFEAIVNPRSSLPKGFGLMLANSQGVIDQSYCGDKDEWKAPLIAIRKTSIEEGERIVQFKIQLSQKATLWQKIKWLFTSGFKFVEVESLNNNIRGGFGSTGKL